MAINKAVLEQIEREKQDPLPTAPEGTLVNWFERNEDERMYAAIVTKVQGPGKVELCVFKPRSMLQHKNGVLHRNHPVHALKSDSATIRNGSWDYLPYNKPHKGHYEVHLKEIERRETHLYEIERQNQQAEQARQAIRQQAEAEKATAK